MPAGTGVTVCISFLIFVFVSSFLFLLVLLQLYRFYWSLWRTRFSFHWFSLLFSFLQFNETLLPSYYFIFFCLPFLSSSCSFLYNFLRQEVWLLFCILFFSLYKDLCYEFLSQCFFSSILHILICCIDFNSFKFVELCVMVQHMVYHGKCSMSTWKMCTLFVRLHVLYFAYYIMLVNSID